MQEMQKAVLAVDIHDDKKCKKRAIKIVSSVAGIDSVSVDTKAQKVTIIGTMDVLEVVKKLRKTYRTNLDTVGPAKEEKTTKPPVEVTPIVYDNVYIPYNPFHPNYYPYYCIY